MLELSSFWDDFQTRVNSAVDCLEAGRLPGLERLTVHLTESCNFACKYCNMRFSGATMDRALALRIVDEYAGMGGRFIHFTGGEPSIVPYIEELFARAKARGLVVSSNSNCFRRMDVRNVDKLKVSFDTDDEAEFDRTVNHPGAYRAVVENLKYYSEQMEGKMFSITAVLTSQTYRNMLELAKFVYRNFRVYTLHFSNYKGSDPAVAFSQEQIDDLFQNHIPETLAFFAREGAEVSHRQLSMYKPSDFANVPVRFAQNRHIPCALQLSEMTVDVHGGCYNCGYLFRDGAAQRERVCVAELGLAGCFLRLKQSLGGNYTLLSDLCLSGCNTNFIAFNEAVAQGRHI